MAVIIKIDDLIKLNREQEILCREMEVLFLKMQDEGIAFAVNEDGWVVAYNSNYIEDCECESLFNDKHDGYEAAEINDMRQLFPVWVCDTMLLKRKN